MLLTKRSTRSCSQSFQPQYDAPTNNHGSEVSNKFLIARGDTSELIEFIEKTLDQVACCIAMSVVSAWRPPVGARRNNRFSGHGFNVLNQGVAIIAFVREYSLSVGRFIQQLNGLSNVGLLRTGQCEAERIDDGVNLGAESAARAAQSLRAMFFWAPAACWWARMAVLSSMMSSKSRSWLAASSTRSHTPLAAQREKRTYAECQLPNSAGKSRHGAPVLAIHKTASINNRLSYAVMPQSVTLHGNNGAIRAHWSSRSTRRSTAGLPCIATLLSVSCSNSLTLIVNTT